MVSSCPDLANPKSRILIPAGLSHDVPRLQVAVNHTSCVCRCQTFGDLPAEGSQGIRIERPSLQQRGKRLPLDQLHHQVVRPDIVQRADMRVIQGGDGAGFAIETCREALMRELDRHRAAQPRIDGAKDFTHTSLAEFALDGVRSEPISRCTSPVTVMSVRGGARRRTIKKPVATAGV